MIPNGRLIFVAIIVSALAVGCGVNWKKRIGYYTYEQAKQDFKRDGFRRKDLGDGRFEVSWVTRQTDMIWRQSGELEGRYGAVLSVTVLTFAEDGTLVKAVELERCTLDEKDKYGLPSSRVFSERVLRVSP